MSINASQKFITPIKFNDEANSIVKKLEENSLAAEAGVRVSDITIAVDDYSSS